MLARGVAHGGEVLYMAFFLGASADVKRFVDSKHPLVRELRMKILTLGLSILNSTHLEQTLESTLRDRLYRAGLSWFEEAPRYENYARSCCLVLMSPLPVGLTVQIACN